VGASPIYSQRRAIIHSQNTCDISTLRLIKTSLLASNIRKSGCSVLLIICQRRAADNTLMHHGGGADCQREGGGPTEPGGPSGPAQQSLVNAPTCQPITNRQRFLTVSSLVEGLK